MTEPPLQVTAPVGGPAPRRVVVGPAGWHQLRAAAIERGVPGAGLPEVAHDPADHDRARIELRRLELIAADGTLPRAVHVGLAALSTGTVTVQAQHRVAGTQVDATWRTLGGPTAGLLVRDLAGGDDRVRREVELQLLTIDRLVDEVLAVLDVGEDDPDHRAGDALELPVTAGVGGVLPAPLGDVVVDGDVTARGAVMITGPTGVTQAQLFGDGRRWWQVGASTADQLRWVPVDRTAVRAALVRDLSTQVAAAPAPPTTAGGRL